MEEIKGDSIALNSIKEGSAIQITKNNLPMFTNNIDPHLMLILIDDSIDHKLYNENSLLKQKLKILMNTYMIDTARKVAEKLGDNEDRSSFDKLQETINEKQTQLTETVSKAMKLETQDNFHSNVLEFNFDNAELNNEEKEEIIKYSKYLYETGNYKDCEIILSKLTKNCKGELHLKCLWGLLNSEILNQNYSEAINTINEIKDFLSNKSLDIDIHASRIMLFSTSLFVLRDGDNNLELIFSLLKRHSSQWSTSAFYLLRYYVVLGFLIEDFDNIKGDILKLICQSSGYLNAQVAQQDICKYKDVFTMFVEALLENFDFDQSISLLAEIQNICKNDYFLRSYSPRIEELTKRMIFFLFLELFIPKRIRFKWLINLVLMLENISLNIPQVKIASRCIKH